MGRSRPMRVYANGVTMTVSGDFPNGIKFYGTKGWIFVSRDEMSGHRRAMPGPELKIEALMASDPKILKSVIGPDEIHLYTSKEQHGNWLDCISTPQAADALRWRWGTAPARLACCTTWR